MSDSTPDTSANPAPGVPRGDDPGHPIVAWYDGQPRLLTMRGVEQMLGEERSRR